MPKEYKFSLQAKQDLLDIFLYGIENWGQQQADNYANELSHCFELLAKNPDIGLNRPELYKNIKSFTIASHVIFYRKTDSIIEISTILHQKIDVRIKFSTML
jgi:toxin ParE1/3/4